jgi:hypothetical protein
MNKIHQTDLRTVAAQLLAALEEAIAEIEYCHADMLSEEERLHSRGSGWARVYDNATAAIAIAKAELGQDIDIHSILSEHRQIAIIWSIHDVQQIRPDLTDDQAWEVLQEVDRIYDAECGINWESIEIIAGDLFPETDSEEE